MSLRRLKDGRYVIRYYRNGPAGRTRVQKILGKVTTKDAKRLHADALAAAARPGQAVTRLTFAQLSRVYLEEQGPAMAPNSKARAESMLKLHLLPVFGHVIVEAIKAIHVRRYQRERIEAEAEPATVNREWNCMRAVLNFGEAHELIDRNPVRRGAVSLLATRGSREEYFEPAEWRVFLAAFESEERWKQHLSSIRNRGVLRFTKEGGAQGVGSRKPDSEVSAEYLARLRAAVPFFRALLFTAARVGELATLAWRDVDLRRGLVTLYQHKTKKAKTLPIAEELRGILATLPAGIGDAPVFTKQDGSPLDVRFLQRAFGVALKLAGIVDRGLTVHSVRHTVGSWLTIAGTPERHIAEVLGHATRTVTSGYAHLAKGSLGPVMETLGRIEREGFRESEMSTAGAALKEIG